MYDLSGIIFQLKYGLCLYGIGGILFFIWSKFWNAEKRNMKELLIGVLCIGLALLSFGYYSDKINNPTILIHEGWFEQEYGSRAIFLEMNYSFTNGDSPKVAFVLDSISKKQIYPADFKKDIKYRIYYEADTKIIVKVEVIETTE